MAISFPLHHLTTPDPALKWRGTTIWPGSADQDLTPIRPKGMLKDAALSRLNRWVSAELGHGGEGSAGTSHGKR